MRQAENWWLASLLLWYFLCLPMRLLATNYFPYYESQQLPSNDTTSTSYSLPPLLVVPSASNQSDQTIFTVDIFQPRVCRFDQRTQFNQLQINLTWATSLWLPGSSYLYSLQYTESLLFLAYRQTIVAFDFYSGSLVWNLTSSCSNTFYFSIVPNQSSLLISCNSHLTCYDFQIGNPIVRWSKTASTTFTTPTYFPSNNPTRIYMDMFLIELATGQFVKNFTAAPLIDLSQNLLLIHTNLNVTLVNALSLDVRVVNASSLSYIWPDVSQQCTFTFSWIPYICNGFMLATIYATNCINWGDSFDLGDYIFDLKQQEPLPFVNITPTNGGYPYNGPYQCSPDGRFILAGIYPADWEHSCVVDPSNGQLHSLVSSGNSWTFRDSCSIISITNAKETTVAWLCDSTGVKQEIFSVVDGTTNDITVNFVSQKVGDPLYIFYQYRPKRSSPDESLPDGYIAIHLGKPNSLTGTGINIPPFAVILPCLCLMAICAFCCAHDHLRVNEFENRYQERITPREEIKCTTNSTMKILTLIWEVGVNCALSFSLTVPWSSSGKSIGSFIRVSILDIPSLSYLVQLWTCLGFCGLSIFYMLSIHNTAQDNANSLWMLPASIIIQINSTLWLGFIQLMLKIYVCNNDDTLEGDSTLECWQSTHILYLVIVSLTLVILTSGSFITIPKLSSYPLVKNEQIFFSPNFTLFRMGAQLILAILAVFAQNMIKLQLGFLLALMIILFVYHSKLDYPVSILSVQVWRSLGYWIGGICALFALVSCYLDDPSNPWPFLLSLGLSGGGLVLVVVSRCGWLNPTDTNRKAIDAVQLRRSYRALN